MLLKGKRYLVTGASAESEIGLAICKALAKNGAHLTLSARTVTSLETTKALLQCETEENITTPLEHVIEPFDLANTDAIPVWIKRLSKEHGPYDGLVHSASFQGYSPLKLLSQKQINQYFDINFSAAAMLISGLSKKGCLNRPSSMVMIGSVAGLKGLKARSLYAASKAALLSLVQSSAIELADKQIRVNYLAPALVDGNKAQQQFAALGEVQSQSLIDAHPLGISCPEDVANSVLFLLSDMSGNTTGSILRVDGGYLA